MDLHGFRKVINRGGPGLSVLTTVGGRSHKGKRLDFFFGKFHFEPQRVSEAVGEIGEAG